MISWVSGFPGQRSNASPATGRDRPKKILYGLGTGFSHYILDGPGGPPRSLP